MQCPYGYPLHCRARRDASEPVCLHGFIPGKITNMRPLIACFSRFPHRFFVEYGEQGNKLLIDIPWRRVIMRACFAFAGNGNGADQARFVFFLSHDMRMIEPDNGRRILGRPCSLICNPGIGIGVPWWDACPFATICAFIILMIKHAMRMNGKRDIRFCSENGL